MALGDLIFFSFLTLGNDDSELSSSASWIQGVLDRNLTNEEAVEELLKVCCLFSHDLKSSIVKCKGPRYLMTAP